MLTLPAATGTDADTGTGARAIHDVLFYTEPAAACPRIADRLLPGLVAGLPTVVIATAAEPFARAWSQDRYLELDAPSLLEHLLIDGTPDTALLAQVWEQLQSRFGGEPLQLFGEMTALALAGGSAPAALQLEELWDGLTREAACDVYCAFPHAAVRDDHGLSLADRISELHGSTVVVGGGGR